MEDAKKWTVTYTKHVKQKRKVYQDGTLHLSNNKVMLYDEDEQLLDSKFLSKNDAVTSGESLAFASFLVDIGDPVNSCYPIFSPNIKSECDVKPREKTGMPQGANLRNSFANRKPQTAGRKSSLGNLSPSQKIIRDFKKSEALKYSARQSPTSPTASTFKEWEALYTTQISQKAKKYHDGFIRMIICGSQGRQIILYDSSKNQIDKKFLKRDEIVSSGESLMFDAHLVDIGDPMGIIEDDADVKIQGRSNNSTVKPVIPAGHLQKKLFSDNSNAERSKTSTPKEQLGSGKSVRIAQPRDDASSRKRVNSRTEGFGYGTNKQKSQLASDTSLRDANQILSILRKPVTGDTIASVTNPVGQCFSKSSELVHLDNSQASNGLLHVDRCQEIIAAEKHNSENSASGEHKSMCSDSDGPQCKANIDDLTASPVNPNHSNKRVESPVLTQVVEKQKSSASNSPHKSQSAVGSKNADLTAAPFNANCSNKRAESPVLTQVVEKQKSTASNSPHKSQSAVGLSVDHEVVIQPSKGFVGSNSSMSSETTTHPQPSTKMAESKTTSTLDMSGSKRFGNLGGLKKKKSGKDDKFNTSFDCPSFDLGI